MFILAWIYGCQPKSLQAGTLSGLAFQLSVLVL